MTGEEPAPLVFEPIPMERVWGGRRLETLYGKRLPPGAPIGEIWELVDREEAQSVIHRGPHQGKTLHELWTNHRKEIFGQAALRHPAPRFPVLIKLLDARQRLSLQVHPPARLAAALRGEPKTEVWYFARCSPGARIYAGVPQGCDRAHFEEMLAAGTLERAVHELPTKTGDSFFIPSGRLHAIGEGNVIVEIQQNSDTTYRVYDWNRTGLDGKPRTLHIAESLACIDFDDHEPAVAHLERGVLADCDFFRVEKIPVSAPLPLCRPGQFAMVTVLQGKLRVGQEVFSKGAFFLLPAVPSPAVVFPEGSEGAALLLTTLPGV